MPKIPTKAQHEMHPTPIANSEEETASTQPVEASTVDQQPIEPDPAKIVDANRTERPVEDLGGEID